MNATNERPREESALGFDGIRFAARFLRECLVVFASFIPLNRGSPVVPSEQLRNRATNNTPVDRHYVADSFLVLHLIRAGREQSAVVAGDR